MTEKNFDTYIEFNCLINDTKIDIANYKRILFGNVSTNVIYNNEAIEFDGFAGIQYFGE